MAHNGFVKLTLAEIRRRVESEGDAYKLLEDLRWKNGPVCPHCGHDKAYFLKPANGVSRASGPKRFMSQRRVWKCAKCRKQFSVLTGTIFQGTKVSIEVWLMVMVQMCSAKNGISAREIERMHGLTPETAWFVLHRLREAMKRDPLVSALRGTVVVADETWIGGEPKNMHANKRPKRGKGYSDQTPVLSLVSVGLDSNEVRSQVIPDVRGSTLRKAIANETVLPEITLFTDSHKGYTALTPQVARHVAVNHSTGEYVKRGAGTNWAENYFSQLKRSIDGTYHHVSREHLPRYLDEFDFRYSTCKMTDGDRLQKMVDQAQGRRLTYRPLKGQG